MQPDYFTGKAVAKRPVRVIDSAAGGAHATGRQTPATVARTIAAKTLGVPSKHHGGPRENGTRMGIGAIAAVGTKAPWPQ